MAVVPSVDASIIPSVPSDLSVSYAQVFAGLAITLLTIATLLFAGRIYTRCFPVFRMQADDWVCCCAYILVTIDTALLLNTVPFVFNQDRYTRTLADSQDSFFFAFIAQPLWAWSMAMIKISVALMLLRLEQKQIWRRFLWILIGVQILLALYNMLTQVMQCFPLEGAWDLLGVIEAKCWSNEAIRVSSICVSSINFITDFIFSLMPISFLRKIQRPIRERAIIGCLMALGLFAGVASIIKMVAAARFGRTNDPNSESIQIGMWSAIEELVGFTASCIPCLRSPFQRILEHFGLVPKHTKSSFGGYGPMYGNRGKALGTRARISVSVTGGNGIKMKSIRGTGVQSEENILKSPTEDAKNSEIWCTTEVHLQEEAAKRLKRSLLK